MSEFPECLLIVIAEVDAAIEGEWNRWYDTVHLPDAPRQPRGAGAEAGVPAAGARWRPDVRASEDAIADARRIFSVPPTPPGRLPFPPPRPYALGGGRPPWKKR